MVAVQYVAPVSGKATLKRPSLWAGPNHRQPLAGVAGAAPAGLRVAIEVMASTTPSTVGRIFGAAGGARPSSTTR